MGPVGAIITLLYIKTSQDITDLSKYKEKKILHYNLIVLFHLH